MIKLVILLQFITAWVQPPENLTQIEGLNHPLVRKNTSLIVEEYIQEKGELRLVAEEIKADIIVRIYFVKYRRPTTEIGLSVLQTREEEVYLTMRIEFYYVKWNFSQSLVREVGITRKAGSNFLNILESETDFAESIIFNLIKKNIAFCFEDYNNLILQ